jgi:predicted nucleic acid-binding protein
MDRRQPEHRFVARVMREAIGDGIILNLMTLVEVAHYFRELDEQEFSSRMDKLRNLRTVTLVELDLTTADTAIRLLSRYGRIGIGGRDAVVLATMQLHGIKRILTHDRDFTKVKGIKVVDPIPLRL